MSDAARYRDSTQIVLPNDVVEELRTDLRREFTLTFVDDEESSERAKSGGGGSRGRPDDRTSSGDSAGTVRIIGSPVEIKDASEWLTRHGVFVP
jgi:hypothetical protein